MYENAYATRPLRTAVGDHVGGGTPPRQVPSYWRGQIPWASVKDFPEQSGIIDDTEEHISTSGLNASASNLISAGTPLVCTRMAVGRAAMPSVPMAINQDVKAIFPAPGVSPAYLLKLLQFIQPKAEAQAVGSTVKGIRIQDYLDIKAPIADTDAQPIIARVLDTLDTAIHETEAIIAKLKAVKQGLLHDLLTRGIAANGELRLPQAEAPHLYKESPLGWIPKEWTTPTFDELESRPTLGLSIRGASADLQNVGLLKMGNLSANNEVDLKSVEPIARDRVADIGKFKLEDGDLLFNTRNTPELVGKTCSWREVPGSEYVFDNNILRARIPRKLGTGHYFADYLGNEIGRRRLLRLATGTTSVAAIYWKDLSEFRMPAPPVCEQLAIHERIDSIDTNRKTAEEAANALLGVKAGLMDDLLTGCVRVTPLLEGAAP